MPRQTPHDFTSDEFSKVLVADHEKTIAKYSASVLDVERDEVLDNHIFRLSIELPQLALLRYYYADASPEEVLDLFAQAAQAKAEGQTDDLQDLADQYLDVHRKFYDSDTDNRRGITMGLVSVPMLAIAVFAKERGYTLELVNDYVPPDLLDAVLARQIRPEPPKRKSGLSRFWKK